MSDRKDAILSMKALFAVVKCYTLLFDSLSSVGKQYGMSVNEIESYGMSHMDTVDDLVSAMPPKDRYIFVRISDAMAVFDNGLNDFMDYDPVKLARLNRNLKSALRDFDAMIQKLEAAHD